MSAIVVRISAIGIVLMGSAMCYGLDRKEISQERLRNEVLIGVGSAVARDGSPLNAPAVSAMYFRKFQSFFGNHVEVVAGIGESYGGIAWQLDAWLFDQLRIGAGFGATPILDEFSGNPILVPMPEASFGYHYRSGNLTYSCGATGNMVYGARAYAGLGLPF
jgi:hypothetical protein